MWIILYVTCVLVSISMGITNYTFPCDFLFGLASSAYQIEGGWNEDGKGENMWDRFTHHHPELIKDHSNGDVACNSYNWYKEDVRLLKQVGVNFYRFSISWSRILPSGFPYPINQAGINYYNNLINELLDNGIEPLVTMFHWDLPLPLLRIGGLVNRDFPCIFEMYADILFEHFGDRVKWWITFNEPLIEVLSYGGSGFSSGLGFEVPNNDSYLAMHYILLAHSKVYRLYERNYKNQQNGKISISLYSCWFEPYSNSTEDIAAAERVIQFHLGIFAHPIFSDEGDYPPMVKERIANISAAEGLQESRLPKFTREEIRSLRGSADFFALNHYTTFLVKDGESRTNIFEKDAGGEILIDPDWESTSLPTNYVVPWGFYKLLVWVSENYNNPPIFITENGYADKGQFNDTGRINYIMKYLEEMLKAMDEQNVNVFGYILWSLMDSFEWIFGYTLTFGIFHVDFSIWSLNRIEKESARVFTEIIETKALPNTYY